MPNLHGQIMIMIKVQVLSFYCYHGSNQIKRPEGSFGYYITLKMAIFDVSLASHNKL